MTINFKAPEIKELQPRLLVLGVGGAGGNAINEMIENNMQGVEFIAVNTDAQDLKLSKAKSRIQIGLNLTKGLGAGAKLDIGQAAADESLNEIVNTLQGANMVFIAAGMGGGTGTGAAPIVADMAKELGILTVAVVTRPFDFEGKKRMIVAEEGILELSKNVDSLITIPNQKLLSILGEDTPLLEAFATVDDVVSSAVQGIADLIIRPGMINVDFADVKTIMQHRGKAVFGVGVSSGEDRAILSAEDAISNPMLDDLSLKGTKGLLVSLTAGADINPFEIQGALSVIQKDVGEECEVIFGIFQDEEMGDNFKTAVIATGMDQTVEEKVVDINPENDLSESNFVDVIDDNEPENVELEVKKTSPEEPHNIDPDDYNDFDDDFSESLSEAVSYTHLTLPTKCSV